ncbi:MAG: amidohydrolase family protein [Pirellula sp.]
MIPMSSTRRQFLQTTSSLIAAASLVRTQSSFAAIRNEVAPVPIIDPHQHLWDLSNFKLSWLDDASDPILKRNYLLEEYREATKNVNVVKAVYMEVDVIPEQHHAEAEFVLQLCNAPNSTTVGAVISGRPGEAGFAKHIERYADNQRIKGVRQVLHGSTPAGYCLSKQFVESVRLLGEMNKCYDLCMRPGELIDAVKLVDQCPKTRFVLDHCGNGPVRPSDPKTFDQWLAGLKELSARSNVVCKISGIVASAPKDWKPSDLEPVVNASIDHFGEDRIMFAGDWPVCLLRSSFEAWVNALKEIVGSRSDSFKAKLFSKNAEKFYSLT